MIDTRIRLRITPLLVATCIVVTGCTKPKQTTAIGAAAGGAIGAGLGAIIGNQTGNAGSGVAIGAAAGAATGALVGNALQAQKEATDARAESIERQERELRAQRSEINELRRMQGDSSGYSQGPTQNVNAYLVEQKRLQLQKRGPAPQGQRAASTYTPPPPLKTSEPLARYQPLPAKPTTPRTTQPVKETTEVLPPPSTSTTDIKEKDLASDAATRASAETTTAKVAAPAPKADSCEESKEARQAAASASENSDKLFHLRKALRLCPNSADTHLEMGKVYLGMDRAADASYEFKQALSINPSHEDAKKSLKELDQSASHY